MNSRSTSKQLSIINNTVIKFNYLHRAVILQNKTVITQILRII
jgi:hypothetical protein